jgi:hypothetical protein
MRLMVLGIDSGNGKWYSFRLESSTFGLITWVKSKTWLSLLVSAFRPRGVLGPTSKLSLRVPAKMGRHEMEHKGERKGEPRLMLSCAQGGCACSRGLQAFAREGESLFVSPSSRAATLSYEGPGPSFYRCKERVQVYNGGCSNVLTCPAERSQSPMYMSTWLSERC